MKKNIGIIITFLIAIWLVGCGSDNNMQEPDLAASAENAEETVTLPDGIYTAEFATDSSMFRVNETCEGRGTLTVENGEMTIHITLGSKKILNLYPGLAEDAAKEGAELLLPTEDTVTYSDGMTEEVYGFNVPVPVLETEFDLALIGTKGKWYDHKVSVSDPVLLEEDKQAKDAVPLEGGTYSMEITFEGGSGKAQILSPVSVTVADNKATVRVQWNSPNYDYMIVDGEKYLLVSAEGDSVFEIPVLTFDEPMDVIGDTVAMSKPHEMENGGTMKGMGLLPVKTWLKREKVRRQVHGTVNEMEGFFSALSGLGFEGYEIHMGESVGSSRSYPEAAFITGRNKNVCGTYIHGIFDRAEIAAALVTALAEKKGISIGDKSCMDYKTFKEKQYDKLADVLSEYLNMEEIYGMLREAHIR